MIWNAFDAYSGIHLKEWPYNAKGKGFTLSGARQWKIRQYALQESGELPKQYWKDVTLNAEDWRFVRLIFEALKLLLDSSAEGQLALLKAGMGGKIWFLRNVRESLGPDGNEERLTHLIAAARAREGDSLPKARSKKTIRKM